MKVLAAVVIVVVGGVLAVVLMDSDSGQPELSATDRAEARRVALGSPELKRILGVAAIVPSESDGFRDWDVPARPDSSCAA